jgi:hypothetical protein
MGRRRTTGWVVLGGVVLSVLGTSGCADPLFSAKHPRTQYDRYDRVRGQFVAQDIEDEFGQKHPNLVGRLGREN